LRSIVRDQGHIFYQLSFLGVKFMIYQFYYRLVFAGDHILSFSAFVIDIDYCIGLVTFTHRPPGTGDVLGMGSVCTVCMG